MRWIFVYILLITNAGFVNAQNAKSAKNYYHRHYEMHEVYCIIDLDGFFVGENYLYYNKDVSHYKVHVRKSSEEIFKSNMTKMNILIQYKTYWEQLKFFIDSLVINYNYKLGEWITQNDEIAYNELFIDKFDLSKNIIIEYEKHNNRPLFDSTYQLITLRADNRVVKQFGLNLGLFSCLFKDYYPVHNCLIISIYSELGRYGEILFNTSDGDFYRTVGEADFLTSDSILCFTNYKYDFHDLYVPDEEVIELFDLKNSDTYSFKLDSLVSKLNMEINSNDSTIWTLGSYCVNNTRDVYFSMEYVLFSSSGERKVLETRYFSLNPRDYHWDHLKR